MKVRILIGRRAGEVLDVPVPDARRLLATGQAVLPEARPAPAPSPPPAPEAAIAAPGETAVAPVRRGARRGRR